MNRPPKKKKQRKDSLVEDPRFDREELEHAGSVKHAPKPSGDDRNLVDIDEAFAEADFEDRMWLFWNKNKTGIIAGVVILILGVIGINTYRLLEAKQHAAMQEEYSAAIGDTEKLKAFGASNADAPLGGLALLEAADAQYAAGDFAAAISLYQQSLVPLQNSVVVGRARLGVAMAQIKAGQADAGKNTLREILATEALLAAVRAEAAVRLAQLELADGNRDAAKQLLDRVAKMSNVEYWQNNAKALLQMERLGDKS